MATHAVTPKGQVTIPKEVREKCGFQPGTIVAIEAHDGFATIRAQRLIDADQAWFWSSEWQEKEREADEDIAAGRVSRWYGDVKELVADLRKGDLDG